MRNPPIVEPKAAALDRIEVAQGNLLLTDAAKVLKVNRSHLITVMFSEKALYRRTENGPLVGQQTWIDAGMLSERLNAYTGRDGADRVAPQILVTQRVWPASRLFSIASAPKPPPVRSTGAVTETVERTETEPI